MICSKVILSNSARSVKTQNGHAVPFLVEPAVGHVMSRFLDASFAGAIDTPQAFEVVLPDKGIELVNTQSHPLRVRAN